MGWTGAMSDYPMDHRHAAIDAAIKTLIQHGVALERISLVEVPAESVSIAQPCELHVDGSPVWRAQLEQVGRWQVRVHWLVDPETMVS